MELILTDHSLGYKKEVQFNGLVVNERVIDLNCKIKGNKKKSREREVIAKNSILLFAIEKKFTVL